MSDNDITKISELIIKDPNFRILSELQDVYCPFEALGVARTEIRHSNFLSNLITPSATHGFGDLFLRSFLEALLSQTEATVLRLDLHLENLGNVEVFREWRHIDILIRLPRAHEGKVDLVFAVELKIEASESSNQLEKYETVVKETWPDASAYFFFLTPDQTAASRETWIDVPFSRVLEEFESALRHGEGQPDARRMTEAYIAMMRRRYVENEQLLQLVSRIWAQHRSALEVLIEHKPDALQHLQQALIESDFLNQIAERVDRKKCQITFQQDTSSSRYLRLGVKEWDCADGMKESQGWVESNRMLLLEIEFYSHSVFARWVVGRGPQAYRLAFIEALDPNRSRKITDDWTRIASRRLLDKADVDKIQEDGLDEKVIRKTIDAVVRYAADTGVKFDQALRNANLLI